MYKRLFALLAVAFCLFLPRTVLAAEVIRSFDVNVAADQGRHLVITENINYDFGDTERHGIYRYIPEVYDRDNATYNYHLDVLDVQRDGKPEPYEVSSGGGNVDIKIGDADVTMAGAHTYTIRYATDRAIGFFDDHDELYWNITGNGWEVPIEQASLSFALPNGVEATKVTTACFTGAYGSTEASCKTKATGGDLAFLSTRVLEPYEGMTVVYGFPKGTFPAPTTQEKIMMLVRDNLPLFFPIIAFAIMFYLWWTRGRDPQPGTVIPEYDPPQKLAPALIGASMTNGSVPQRTVTATIIDLARRGYLKIDFGEKKGLFGTSQTFTFVKQKDVEVDIPDYDRHIFEGLFKGGDKQSVSELSDGKFYTTVTTFTSDVARRISGMKIFHANPGGVRTLYIIFGIVITTLLFVFTASNGLGAFCAVVTGLVICIFGWFMPKRTAEGIKLYTDILGFKWFLSVTEKDRMDFHNAPERTPKQFQELLPYAIVFGVENKWAAQFASMNIPPPDWATGNVSSMNTVMLASSLNSLHSAASSSAFSPPSSAGSGGSGFSGGGSGGGGGGGGGGSW